jgi:bifunctional non-homologous end joining protein LigD
MPPDDPTDRLEAYRAKRAAERTPEPFGGERPATAVEGAGRLFVVHKHGARRLHYDLRLELGGALVSWAVPKGPSRDPADKRLAVHVEDHPLEYADFEGVIPEGNYGAGTSIVWDRGAWIAIEDPMTGLEKGKLLFELRGYKLRGTWTLVKIKKSENEWLLIKERDAYVDTDGGDVFPEGSVLSGLTIEALGSGLDVGAEIGAELERAGAKEQAVPVGKVDLMLAETRQRAFSRPGWIYELKYDGYRILAAREDGEARLLTRNRNDATATFPEVAKAIAALPYDGLVLDGEVAVLDETGRPSFQRLQRRGRLSRESEIAHAAVALQATYFAFDLIACEGYDLRDLPLLERKRLLRTVLPEVGPLKYTDHVEDAGEAFYDEVVKLGLEGVVAKSGDSRYRGGRSSHWVKLRADRTDDFVVVGYTQAKGGRGGFGALHLAAYEGDALRYAGRVGSGFDTRQLAETRKALDAITRAEPACSHAPSGADHAWVEPEFVCEVRYKEWTDENLLRQPVFLHFRDDKPPTDCLWRGGAGDLAAVGAVDIVPDARHVEFTNLDKVFWPNEGYTKGDLIEYYRSVSSWILPYLHDRPVVMTRFPDGIDGKSFFQKDAPGYAPPWLRRLKIWSEDSQRDLNYFVVGEEAGLLYIANMASIPLHVWGSRIGSLEQPDWCILDLDPKGAPFTDVIEVARAVKLGRQCTFDQAKTLGELLARVVAAELPEIATITRHVSKREGKVYVDYLQNGHGKLLVAPFSVRPLLGAPVSTPLRWSEVKAGLTIEKFTIRTVPTRLKRLKTDPWSGLLEIAPDLPAVLGKLGGRL